MPGLQRQRLPKDLTLVNASATATTVAEANHSPRTSQRTDTAMRELIACLSIWLGAPCRRQLHFLKLRATELFARPEPQVYEVFPSPPAYAHRPVPAHVRARQLPLDGHSLDLVRPYVRAHSQRTTFTAAGYA